MIKHDYDSGVSSSDQATSDHVAHLSEQGNEIPPQNNPQVEARGSLRRRVLKSAQIAINQIYAKIPCRVKNLSQTGALIEVAEKYIVPDKFDLAIPMDGFSVQAQVVHRHQTKIGLKFVGDKQTLALDKSQSIRSSSDPYLECLVRKDNYAVDTPSETELAIRRHGNQPPLARPGFGRR